MPRQANGTYVQPANTAAISGTSISSTAFNTLETDIGTEITNSVDRLGRSAMEAALQMGSNNISGMADPVVSTDAATKNYVDTSVSSFFSTGDVKLTIKTSADTGWVMCNDGTIGSASSGATSYANALALNLFTLIFNNITDTFAPIFTSGGGATTRAAQTNAATAWAANCSISLTKMMGRALGISGAGSGLTATTLGQTIGTNTQTLAVTNLPPVTGLVTVVTGPLGIVNSGSGIGSASFSFSGGGGSVGTLLNAGATATQITSTGSITGGTILNGTSTAFSIMQPTSFLNAMIKI